MNPGIRAGAILWVLWSVLTPVGARGADGGFVLQGGVGAAVFGPRRIATTSVGQFAVVDGRGRLQLLTKRGDLVGTLLERVKAVAAGGGRIYAVDEKVELVVLDERYGRVEGRTALGFGVAPMGMSYDAERGVVWLAFNSGMVQARKLSGELAVQFSPAVTGMLYGLSDVAVDAGAGVVWVARDREYAGGMIIGLDPATGSRKRVIGGSGSGPVKMTGALLATGKGQLYVADMFGNRVEVVGTDDTRVETIGVDAAGVGMMSQPAGLAFMENGDLLVSNLYASRFDRYGHGAPLPECVGDADCDGASDGWEKANGFDAVSAKDALLDADLDGLPNAQEYALGTDPRNADTDGDGETDGVEVASGTDPLVPPYRKPVVVAGAGAEWVPGIVRLSATVTEVKDPTGCAAAWKQVEGPPVTLKGAGGFAPSFVTRDAAEYRFTVEATCGGLKSEAAEAVATVVNVAPLAEAPRVVVVEGGTTLTVDAWRTGDANADALGFRWEQVSGPAVTGGSTASALVAGFEAPGTHRFTVTAADAAEAVGTATTSVVVVGKQRVPVAVVGTPVVGEVGRRVVLDATRSLVAGAAAYEWQQVAGPGVALESDGGAVAGFVAAEPGRYAFEVTVRKGGVTSPPAVAEVYVGAAGKALPVAKAVAPAVAAVGTEIELDGTGSAGTGTRWAWRQVSGPATGVGSAERAVATAYLFEAGTYEFELVVSDDVGVGVPVRVRVEGRAGTVANPVARIQAATTAKVGHEVVLDGRGSTGAKGYRWTQVGGPWVALGSGAVARFHATAAGTYEIELEVDDGRVVSAPARVTVVVGGEGN